MNKLFELFSQDKLFVAPGVYNGLSAKLAERAGFEIIYASGGAISRSTGLPDLGILSYTQIADILYQVAESVSVPVIGDFDNGYGNQVNVSFAAKRFKATGVSGVHMEDQQLPKRCGHYDGQQIVSVSEFSDKIKAFKDSVGDDLYLIARTDAIAVNGIEDAVERAHQYMEAGADMIFVEAPRTEEQIKYIGQQLHYPKLLNMFYSGKTPVVALDKLKEWGYNLVVDPSDLQRASIKAMQDTLAEIRVHGHSKGIKDRLVSFAEREEIIGTKKVLNA
ncbi:isocitrate lyase/PEP mutase family protein [Vibrio sp. S4M6]|uniref:isocitrate lyase/PEP mutase family protein n=1 Tax=Vibrio sinus TaxID=2946865 RepID=UPI002029FE36|nr:isocitrate lyase/PEP mutase family protein [Vibrio sinus]MCL9780216.1 isocitrate lyase/PEP mutase family protein [Vibrio sinus]